MTIANAIKNYRTSQGLSQTALGEKIGKTKRTIIRYEKGQTLPSFEVLEKIFNIDIQKLIFEGVQ
ncbi:XRE family transcriptional regulator [Clostridium botulinum]|uniref:XRE family transcriptional regulator n=1 Tax=Clostridium botulinum TaxID=1491 RepID=A0A6M0SQ24_CLOBO|nr:helix-turn-helix transcriptional regulator [Clostridium botulinum]MBY6860772.1 helix-turn-helix transcriptional regulator [Clostridium botulinum]MBY7043839.1 helix-turn-helix transcriptional regulator [Clostridium botulinum]NFA43391.1 XRE family transcriptional regulator [Clostridium botulinum]NFO35119.1 helix-turn-helix transcriptional regulator [Clostridium botulinum]NFO48403.1 helix-turn-helix transcriptional regulator [Clostridium botulinum]